MKPDTVEPMSAPSNFQARSGLPANSSNLTTVAI
jgi:hypothetical protein